MFSTWTLVIIAIAQFSPFVLHDFYNCPANFELIIDKFTLILLLILLYCRGSFKHDYIKAFILMFIIVMGLLIISKLSNIQFSNEVKSDLWEAYNQVEIIGDNAIL